MRVDCCDSSVPTINQVASFMSEITAQHFVQSRKWEMMDFRINIAPKCWSVVDVSLSVPSQQPCYTQTGSPGAAPDAASVRFIPSVRGSIQLFYWPVTVTCGMYRFASGVVYFGLSLSTSTLAGNRYINFLISGLVEAPAYALIVVVLQKSVGRLLSIMCYNFHSSYLLWYNLHTLV